MTTATLILQGLLLFSMCTYVDDVFNQWRHQPVNMASRFRRHFRRSSISNVNFFGLTKRCSPILLPKLLENYAVLGKWIKYIYVNFGVHAILKPSYVAMSRKNTVDLQRVTGLCLVTWVFSPPEVSATFDATWFVILSQLQSHDTNVVHWLPTQTGRAPVSLSVTSLTRHNKAHSLK